LNQLKKPQTDKTWMTSRDLLAAIEVHELEIVMTGTWFDGATDFESSMDILVSWLKGQTFTFKTIA
jgi:hypothetical protein